MKPQDEIVAGEKGYAVVGVFPDVEKRVAVVKSLEQADVRRYDARLEIALAVPVADQDVEGGERRHLVGVCQGDSLALRVKDVRKRDAGCSHFEAGVGRAVAGHGQRSVGDRDVEGLGEPQGHMLDVDAVGRLRAVELQDGVEGAVGGFGDARRTPLEDLADLVGCFLHGIPRFWVINFVIGRRGKIMKKIFAAFLLVFQAAAVWAGPFEPARAGTIEVCFTPGEDYTGKIVREISDAREEILVQAYSFTSAPIVKALVAAHRRGVRVETLLDKSQRKEKYTSATFLDHADVPVLIDDAHAIAHNKVMIIDRGTVITGSFNFTKAAQEKNAENLLVIKGNKALVEEYLANYAVHREHAEAYGERAVTTGTSRRSFLPGR